MTTKITRVDDDMNAGRNIRRLWPTIARRLNLFYKYHFGIYSFDTISISTDPDNPTYVTGLGLFPTSSEGFTIVDASRGIVRNDTGRTLTMSGTVTYQGEKVSSGRALLHLWSEKSNNDFQTFEVNQNSLRTTPVSNSSSDESSTKSAGIANWESGQSARFAMYNSGAGSLVLQTPEVTVNHGETVHGFSFYMQLNEV